MLFMKSPQVSDYAPWAKKQNTIQSWPAVKTHRHLLTERKKMMQCCGLHGFLKWRLAHIFWYI